MEEFATETVSGAWDTMGPAAALFIVLLVMVVGGIWLASVWIKHSPAKKVKNTPKPAEPRITETMMGRLIGGMRAGDVHAARQTSSIPPIPPTTDESSRVAVLEANYTALEKDLDEAKGEIKNLRRWRSTLAKEMAAKEKERVKEERLRTADMIRLSNRIGAIEISSGMAPGGSGITIHSMGSLPPESRVKGPELKPDDWDDDGGGETMG